MNSKQFCNSFRFLTLSFTKEHQSDFTAGSGVPRNYFGLLLSGSARIVTKGKTLDLEKNQPFFIPIGCKYRSYWYPENGKVLWHSLGFELLPFQNSKKPALQQVCFTPQAWQLFYSIANTGSVTAQTIGTLYLLLHEVQNSLSYTVDRQNQTVEKALALIGANPASSICQIARGCGVSESTLYSAFKSSLGHSPNFERQKALCEKAVRLLQTTDCPVEEISNELGFSSSSYFRKVLRQHTGMTPREIRKNGLF